MNFLLLSKKIAPIFCPRLRRLLPSSSSSSSSSSSLSSATQSPDPNGPFTVNDYLISTFGFSPAKAAAISKPIAYLKSPHNPDAVRGFLQHQGFAESEIKTIIARSPSILCSSPENTLGPNILALHNMGLSTSALTQIILSGPVALQLFSAVPRIKFWMDFLGGDEALLVRVFKRNRGLICHHVNGGIVTKISLLRTQEISTNDIHCIICTIRGFIMRSVSAMSDVLKRAKELGFQPGSGMFKRGLHAMNSVTNEALQKRRELLKSFGWSEEEFLSAVHKSPTIVCLSEENLQAKMDFLLGEVKCDVSYITFRPVLLTYCLEKRIRPRYHVLRLLHSKDVYDEKKDFCAAIQLSESKFLERYLVPHKDKISELPEVYLAACSSGSRKTILGNFRC